MEHVPEGFDPLTAEWAAEVCDAMAARLLADADSRTAYLGAELCAHSLRLMLRVWGSHAPGFVAAPD